MPTAIATKNAMNGTKRKGAPSKDVARKDSKKPKIDSNKKATTKQPKVAPETVKRRATQSDSEDSDSGGGVPLFGKESSDSSGLDESDTTEYVSEGGPAAKDGVHPERLKAAAVNSKNIICFAVIMLTTTRSIIERGTCEAKAIGPREKGGQTFG